MAVKSVRPCLTEDECRAALGPLSLSSPVRACVLGDAPAAHSSRQRPPRMFNGEEEPRRPGASPGPTAGKSPSSSKALPAAGRPRLPDLNREAVPTPGMPHGASVLEPGKGSRAAWETDPCLSHRNEVKHGEGAANFLLDGAGKGVPRPKEVEPGQEGF